MSNFIRIWDIDDNETLLNLNTITNITVLDTEKAVIVFNSGNFMEIYIETYINILHFLNLLKDDEILPIFNRCNEGKTK